MGKTCCFIGQEECTVTDSMRERLPDILKKLIEYMDVDHFLFGKRSTYMTFCRAAVREAKKKYPQITMQEYRMPPGVENNGFARERGMIDESCVYIFYYDPKGRALCTLLPGSPARDRTEAAFLYRFSVLFSKVFGFHPLLQKGVAGYGAAPRVPSSITLSARTATLCRGRRRWL